MKAFHMKETEVIRNLLGSMGSLDKETLQATLAYLIKTYVIDKQSFGSDSTAGIIPGPRVASRPADFTELITEIKRNYTMPELNKFSIEGGKVFVVIDNKRYQLSSAAEPRSTGTPPDNRNTAGSFKQQADSSANRFRNLEMDE
jgi:predicted heme/steroid binding protein